MKNRKSLYNDSSIQLIREDDHYVLVTKQKNVKIENRTYDEDQKAMLEGATVDAWCKKFDVVYSVFDVPAVKGKLFVYTTNGNFSRRVMTMGEHEDFAKIVINEYKLPYMFYGEMKDADESGYVMMFGRKIGEDDFVSDDFCEKMILETSNPKVKWHLYCFDEHDEPESDVVDEIFDKYRLKEDKMMGLYVSNDNGAGHWAFLEFPNWKIIPGSAYSKRR